jgi:signal transduction histidine kinase
MKKYCYNTNKVLVDRDVLQKIDKMLNNSLYSTQMLNNLINDLLDMAKFEQGKFIFSEHFFNLPNLVIKALNIIKYFADEREILLILLVNSKKKQMRIVIGDNQESLQDFCSIFTNIYGDERRF